MELLLSAIVSVITTFIQKKFGTSEYTTLLALLIVSVVSATIYTLVKDSALWPTVYAIVINAAAFYALILRRFEIVKK